MRQSITVSIVFWFLASMAFCTHANAQGITPSRGITGATTGGGLVVTNGKLGAIPCTAGQVLVSTGSAWTCGPAGATYSAGSGLTLLSYIFAIDPAYTQRRVSGTCAAGTTMRAIAQDGTVTCETATLTLSGLATVGGLYNTAQTRRTGSISVSLSASQNDWAPSGLAAASFVDITPTAAWTLTGLTAQPAGTEIVLRNRGPYTIQLEDLHVSSATANQFDNGGFDLALEPYQIVTLRHNGTNWTTMGTSGMYLSITTLTAAQGITTTALQFVTTDWTTTGTSNDVNAFASFQYTGAGDATVTGFLGGAQGRAKFVQNVSTFNLTLANETGSAAGRQIKTPGSVDLVLGPRCGALLTYETAQSYWQVQGYICDRISMPTTFTSTKNTGTITLAAGTGTATVKSGAVCVCSDTTAVNAVQCAVATTTLTATGTGTDVIAYHCF